MPEGLGLRQGKAPLAHGLEASAQGTGAPGEKLRLEQIVRARLPGMGKGPGHGREEHVGCAHEQHPGGKAVLPVPTPKWSQGREGIGLGNPRLQWRWEG